MGSSYVEVRRVHELCVKWPTTGKPFKEVFADRRTGHQFTRWYNEIGQEIFNDEYKVIPRIL